MADACNQLVTAAGFSPRQWVPGAGRRLPPSLAGPGNDPAVVESGGEFVVLLEPARLSFHKLCLRQRTHRRCDV
eukprot:6621677-Pyramimonas_sp.AAC.1